MRFWRRFHALRASIWLASAAILLLGVSIWFRAIDLENSSTSAPEPTDSPYSSLTMKASDRPSALFVGDEFTAGYGGIRTNAYPYIACSALGLNCNVDAQTGTGLISDGDDVSPGTSRLIDRLATDRQIYAVDFLIVDAGRNDLRAPVETYGTALREYLTEAKRIWPAAKVVVIAPTFLTGEPDSAYASRTSMIGNVTESFNGILIDPVTERWYWDLDLPTMGMEDGIHPNNAGHAFIGHKLEDSLRAHGIGQPGETE